MTKSDLIKAVALRYPEISQKEMELIVNLIFTSMSEALYSGQRIELRGFGSMEVRTRKPRIARNPKTGERIKVDARRTVVFHSGRELAGILKEDGAVCSIDMSDGSDETES